MPQISAQSTRSPAKICARLSPPKTGRRRRGASGTVGGGSSSSVCSAMVADPFRQLRGNDPVPAQDDQEDGDGEMCREEQVPEGLDTRCICLDISAGEIVELMHHPVERSAAQEKKDEREQDRKSTRLNSSPQHTTSMPSSA